MENIYIYIYIQTRNFYRFFFGGILMHSPGGFGVEHILAPMFAYALM